MTFRRGHIPGVLVQARGLRGPKGEPGDITVISSAISTYLSNYANISHTHGVSVLGHNISATSASNGLILSVAPPSAAANSLVAGDYISMSVNGVVSTISVTGLQSAGPYLTTAAASDHTHSQYLTTAAASDHTHTEYQTTGAYLTTAAESWHSHNDLYIPLTSASNFALGTHNHGSLYTASITGSLITNSSVSSGLTLGVPRYLTTAANSTHTHGSAVVGINITGASASNGLTLSVANAIPLAYSSSFGQSWQLAGTHTAGTTASPMGSVLYLQGGDNITLSGNSNTIVISGNAGTGGAGGVGIGNTATIPFTSGSVQFSGENLTVNTSQGTGTQSTNQYIQLSVAAPDAAANSVYAGDYISLSTAGANTTVSAVGLQATSAMSNYLAVSNSSNLVAVSNSSLFIPQASAGNFFLDAFSSLLQATSNNSLSLGTGYTTHTHSGYLTTAAASNHTHNYAAVTHNHGSVAITGGIGITSSSNGLSVSLPPYLTTAAHSTHIHGSINTASTSGTDIKFTSASSGLSVGVPPYLTTVTNGSVVFSNVPGQGITFGSSTSGYSTTITASAAGGTAAGGNQITLSGNTAGTLAIISSGTLTLAGGNNITLRQSGNRVSVIGNPSGNVYFNDSNGISFGSSTSGVSTTITASINAGLGGAHTIYAIGNTESDSSMSYSDGQAYSISASNNLTVRVASNRIIQMWGEPAGIAGIGNTATVPFTSGSVRISGVNLTINTSSAGASQYLQISAPALGYLFFSNTNGHSWGSSVNGMSTSIYIIT